MNEVMTVAMSYDRHCEIVAMALGEAVKKATPEELWEVLEVQSRFIANRLNEEVKGEG